MVVVVNQRRFNGTDPAIAVFHWIDSLIAPRCYEYTLTQPGSSPKITRSDVAGKTVVDMNFVPSVVLVVHAVQTS
jgi:hypothetical protein